MTSSFRLPADAPGARGELADRNERCQEVYGCTVAELFAILVVVVHYKETGFSYARLEADAAVARLEGLGKGGEGVSSAAKRGMLKSIGKIYGWTHYLPGPRAFQLFGLPIPPEVQ